MSKKEYPTQHVLELACAAQRINGAYIKETNTVFADDGVAVYTQYPNKIMMLYSVDDKMVVADLKALKILPEDVVRANEIRAYYKRLLFAAIDGESEFLTSINTILGNEMVKENQFGYVACLPSVQLRDQSHLKVKKASSRVEEGYLGKEGDRLEDLDCEILEVIKSKNFTGWNICAIINGKMASWMSQVELKTGPCVIVKAKVKAQGKHWKHQNDETRLNFVKAAQ